MTTPKIDLDELERLCAVVQDTRRLLREDAPVEKVNDTLPGAHKAMDLLYRSLTIDTVEYLITRARAADRLLEEALYAQWRLESCVSLQPGAQEVLDGMYEALRAVGEWPRGQEDFNARSRRFERRCAEYQEREGADD